MHLRAAWCVPAYAPACDTSAHEEENNPTLPPNVCLPPLAWEKEHASPQSGGLFAATAPNLYLFFLCFLEASSFSFPTKRRPGMA